MCKFLLKAINGLFLVMGVALCGLLGYGYSQYNTLPGVTVLLLMGLAIGVFVILVSCLGCAGEVLYEKGNGCGKCLLALYALIVFVLVVIQLAAAGLLVAFFSNNQDLKNAVSSNPEGKQAVQEFAQFVNCTYNACCGDIAIEKKGNFSKIFAAKCPDSDEVKKMLPGGKGKAKPASSKGGKGGLTKADVAAAMKTGVKEVCDSLQAAKIIDWSQCQQPSGVGKFNGNIFNFFNKNLTTIGCVLCGLAVVQLLAFFGAVYHICCGGLKKEEDENMDSASAPYHAGNDQTSVAANTVAYGT